MTGEYPKGFVDPIVVEVRDLVRCSTVVPIFGRCPTERIGGRTPRSFELRDDAA